MNQTVDGAGMRQILKIAAPLALALVSVLTLNGCALLQFANSRHDVREQAAREHLEQMLVDAGIGDISSVELRCSSPWPAEYECSISVSMTTDNIQDVETLGQLTPAMITHIDNTASTTGDTDLGLTSINVAGVEFSLEPITATDITTFLESVPVDDRPIYVGFGSNDDSSVMLTYPAQVSLAHQCEIADTVYVAFDEQRPILLSPETTTRVRMELSDHLEIPEVAVLCGKVDEYLAGASESSTNRITITVNGPDLEISTFFDSPEELARFDGIWGDGIPGVIRVDSSR